MSDEDDLVAVDGVAGGHFVDDAQDVAFADMLVVGVAPAEGRHRIGAGLRGPKRQRLGDVGNCQAVNRA